jgi:hypothetical protein
MDVMKDMAVVLFITAVLWVAVCVAWVWLIGEQDE